MVGYIFIVYKKMWPENRQQSAKMDGHNLLYIRKYRAKTSKMCGHNLVYISEMCPENMPIFVIQQQQYLVK